jgi:hypothetical protein
MDTIRTHKAPPLPPQLRSRHRRRAARTGQRPNGGRTVQTRPGCGTSVVAMCIWTAPTRSKHPERATSPWNRCGAGAVAATISAVEPVSRPERLRKAEVSPMPELVFPHLDPAHPVPERVFGLCNTSAGGQSVPLPPPPFAPNPVSAPVTAWSRRSPADQGMSAMDRGQIQKFRNLQAF